MAAVFWSPGASDWLDRWASDPEGSAGEFSEPDVVVFCSSVSDGLSGWWPFGSFDDAMSFVLIFVLCLRGKRQHRRN